LLSESMSLLAGFEISTMAHLSFSVACREIVVIGLPQYWRRQVSTSSKYSDKYSECICITSFKMLNELPTTFSLSMDFPIRPMILKTMDHPDLMFFPHFLDTSATQFIKKSTMSCRSTLLRWLRYSSCLPESFRTDARILFGTYSSSILLSIYPI